MPKIIFILFIFSFLSIGCIKELEKSPLHYIGLLALGDFKSLNQDRNTFPNELSFIFIVGDQITINLPNHESGSGYNINPSLPNHLILDPNTGIISGIATEPLATTTFIVTQTKPDRTQVIYRLTITISGSSGPGQVATPMFSPPSGIHSNIATTLTISTATSGANIYFTINGDTPTTSSNLYSTPIHISVLIGRTLKAIATKTGMIDSDIATISGFSYPPLKTGQKTVYETGDNGTHQSGVNRGYTDNADGTVTDNATGLVWQKCSRGQNNDSTCSGTATTTNWVNAGTHCSNLSLAGRTWRLPTRRELGTLPDYGKASNPTIDTTLFPSTVSGGYWSSTSFMPNTALAFFINFSNGAAASSNKGIAYNVRCVSGLQQGYVSNLTDNGDGTVKENTTGLVWQKCSRGQTNDATCSGSATISNWSTAISYCNGLTLASRTWRLPNVNELKTILDTTKTSSPVIDTAFFPSTVADGYWSSTTYAPNTPNAWSVDFGFGSVGYGNKTSDGYVRCVSGP